MKKATLIIITLGLLLIASNMWWAYRSIDFGVTHTYLIDSYERSEKALDQTLMLLPVVAQDTISREKVIRAARLANETVEPFEKEGYIWVGEIGLKFNKENKLIEARRVWSQ